MAIQLADTVTVTACNAIVDAVDRGAGAGKLIIASESTVSDPDTAISVTLAICTISDPSFTAAAVNGNNADATADAITSDTDTTAGTCLRVQVVYSD